MKIIGPAGSSTVYVGGQAFSPDEQGQYDVPNESYLDALRQSGFCPAPVAVEAPSQIEQQHAPDAPATE